MNDQALIFGILALALALFVWGRWRYDVVAVLALLAATITDLVPVEEAFSGFGHPAVVTVAAVLVVSRALQYSGIVDLLAEWVLRVGERTTLQVLALTALVAIASAFMNNVGALALLMPVAIRVARSNGLPPSRFLMPLAFGSLLGGMVTLIGTPPNIIIASFRDEVGPEPFRMFDFAPIGLGVAVVGVLFLSLLGWRLLPTRKGQVSREDLFNISEYMTEVRVPEGSKMVGRLLREIETATDAGIVVAGLVRGDQRLSAPSTYLTLRADDILVVEAYPQDLDALVDAAGLELVGSKERVESALGSDEVSLVEAVILPGALMEGRSAQSLNLRWRHGINLLALSRQGAPIWERLATIRFRAGDVLLLQGQTEMLQEAMRALGCLPLAERGLRVGQPRRLILSVAVFGVALLAAALDILPVQVAFPTAALAMVLFGFISLREAYESIDWSIIVLIGAMIPLGLALESTGGAELLASRLLDLSGSLPPIVTLTIIFVVTMFLSDLINNAAAAVLMAPIALNAADGLGAAADPFLMSVAIGASLAMLTPIGHQSNTLVMGPGGYKFGDYWRLGLPLEALIVVVAVPLLVLFWPL